jgi:hypothetical protein
MDFIMELLKITIPSLIVFLTAYLVIKKFFENQEKQRKHDLLGQHAKTLAPIKLQAYERLIMFLERISPDSIIMRHTQQVKTAKELQSSLLNTIRAEYEHNLSQQIYISSQAWEMVKNAKAKLIQLINTTANGIDEKAPALSLSQSILENIIEMKKSPVYDAIEFLKNEVKEYLQ